MTGDACNAELPHRIPIAGWMMLPTEPGSAFRQPALPQLLNREVKIVEAEFCSAADANIVILRRPRKRLVKADRASVVHWHSLSKYWSGQEIISLGLVVELIRPFVLETMLVKV
jgi:hypothetical protein